MSSFEIYREYNGDGETVEVERETLHVMDDEQRVALVETRTQGNDPAPGQVVRYQMGNHLGSVSLELDDEARVISYEEYHPYGTTAYQVGRSEAEVSLKRYRYTGKERDEETGFSYHGARYYIPWLGRWLSTDPNELSDSINLYPYVSGQPTIHIDANGLEKQTPEQLFLSQSKPYRQPVTATRHGRGTTSKVRANLRKAAKMWGGPEGPIQAGHVNKPFVLTKGGETGEVFAQNRSSNARQGATTDKQLARDARSKGNFTRVKNVDVDAPKGKRYGQPPENAAFQDKKFKDWREGKRSGGRGNQGGFTRVSTILWIAGAMTTVHYILSGKGKVEKIERIVDVGTDALLWSSAARLLGSRLVGLLGVATIASDDPRVAEARQREQLLSRIKQMIEEVHRQRSATWVTPWGIPNKGNTFDAFQTLYKREQAEKALQLDLCKCSVLNTMLAPRSR